MNVIDAVVILFLLLGAAIGFKQGVIKKTTSFLGIFIVVILAFLLKNPLSKLLYSTLPFFSFGGSFKGVELINVVIYEIISFIVVFAILMIIYRIILVATGIVEKLLKFTIVLGIPSKILGAIVGAIEAYFYIFVAFFILAQPSFNIDIVDESNSKSIILKNTPILTNLANNTLNTYYEIYDIIDNHSGENTLETNQKMLDVLLKYHVLDPDSATSLVEQNKINIDGSIEIINKYRKE